jgi:hypothetical protein
VNTEDLINISAFLQQSSATASSLPMPSLTTPQDINISSSSTYHPTLADAIDELTLSTAERGGPPDPIWPTIAHPDNVSSLSAAPSPLAPQDTITVPQTGRRLIRAPSQPADRRAFTRDSFPTQIPIRVYFLCRQYRRRKGIMGAITSWRLRIEEAYLGAFAEFDISIPPRYYVFEDLGNPLCFVGRGINGDGILFTFPLRHSPAWRANNIKDGGDASQALFPCYLPLAISRPPRVGGFLHPHCYGVPGHINSCKRSNQPFYLVLHTFEGDGVVLCQSWASALYRGRAASHFSRGGQITMKDFPTEMAVLEAARLTTPTVVKVPELVPYIRSQLEHLEMVDDMDLQGVIHDPIVINNQPIGRTTPQLYSYTTNETGTPRACEVCEEFTHLGTEVGH